MNPRSLDIVACGAVTPVGLTAAQSCAAIRAAISNFEDVLPLPPPAEPVVGARVPAHSRLRSTEHFWLLNLAARAIGECLDTADEANRTALLAVVPEDFRKHPAVTGLADVGSLREQIEEQLGVRFSPESKILRDGHAGALKALGLASELLGGGRADACIVGGVDSLLNETDIERLQSSSRLRGPNIAQGVVPGEAAAFLRVTSSQDPAHALARVLGVGVANEPDAVLGERYSQGRGLQSAVQDAISSAGVPEAQIAFRVSDMNGERYRAWESFLAECRSYRTRREAFPAWYPAASIGDVGAAAGAMSVVTAAVGMSRGYAPGHSAICEGASDEGLRAAIVLTRV